MKNQWFRLYAEMVDDEKVGALAFSDRWFFVAILCLKCDGTLDNYIGKTLDKKVAFKLRISLSEVEELKTRLLEEGLVDISWQPVAWDRRQFKSDSSAERVKRHREKKSKLDQSDGTMKRDCNVTETPPDTETDTETDTQSEGESAGGPVAVEVSHREFLDAYPRKQDYSVAQVRTEWVALAHKGTDMRMLVEAAKGYALRSRSNGTEERYIPRPENWLSKRMWDTAGERKAQASRGAAGHTPTDAAGWFSLLPDKIGGPIKLASSSDEFAAWSDWSKRTRGRGIPAPHGEWWFPCRWPPGHEKHVAPVQPESEAAA